MQPSINPYQQEICASTERMMMRLQEHQDHLLKVHEEYLKHQAQYSQECLHLMQQQYQFFTANSVESFPQSVYSNSFISVSSEQPKPNGLLTPNSAPVQTALSSISTSLNAPDLENQADTNVSTLTLTNGEKNGEKLETEAEILTPPIQPSEPVTSMASISASDVDLAPLTTTLLEVVSEKTGYPIAMLELEMEMEADLGIDSIKRVEILGAMQERFPDLPSFSPEDLAELQTLGQIVEYMGKKKIVL